MDAATNRVVERGPWVPAFLPRGLRTPDPGLRLYIDGGNLYAAETDTNGRLSATSFVNVGVMWWISISCIVGFGLASATARGLSRRFLRNYFAVRSMQVPSVEEALRSGESQIVEFKRGLSGDEAKAGGVEEEVVRSIAAFANTNGGVIFTGIDDAGHVKGLELDFAERDRLERKIQQLIRARIRPTPPVEISFDEV